MKVHYFHTAQFVPVLIMFYFSMNFSLCPYLKLKIFQTNPTRWDSSATCKVIFVPSVAMQLSE